MSTREGLMTPHLNFTQKDMNTMKHGLLAFAKANRQSRLDSMQDNVDAYTATTQAVAGGHQENYDRSANVLRMHTLQSKYAYPWTPVAYPVGAAPPAMPPLQAGTGAPRPLPTFPPVPPRQRHQFRHEEHHYPLAHIPSYEEYSLLPQAQQRVVLFDVRSRLRHAGVEFPSNSTYATLRRRYAGILDNAPDVRR
jgi:hypothetical protein